MTTRANDGGELLAIEGLRTHFFTQDGVVKAVDTRAGALVIAHDPIPALGWPAMTMPIKVTDPKLLGQAAVGAKVQFVLADGKEPKISALKVVD